MEDDDTNHEHFKTLMGNERVKIYFSPNFNFYERILIEIGQPLEAWA